MMVAAVNNYSTPLALQRSPRTSRRQHTPMPIIEVEKKVPGKQKT